LAEEDEKEEDFVPPEPEVRQFSKENHPEERAQKAEEICGLRHSYFERKADLETKLSELQDRKIKSKTELDEASVELAVLSQEFAERKNSLVLSMIDSITKRQVRLRFGIGDAQQKIMDLQEESVETENAIEEMTAQMGDREFLTKAKATLSEFYSGESAAYGEDQRRKQEIQDDQDCQVENVIRSYDAFIIHAIRPDFTPGTNSPLREGVDWEDKLRLDLAMEPALSASTVREDFSGDTIFGRSGLFIAGGQVQGAYERDAGSTSAGGQSRSSLEWTGGRHIGEQLDLAVTTRSYQEQNELIIDNPKFCGLFLCLDKVQKYDASFQADFAAPESLHKQAEDLHLPVYLVDSGQVFESTYDPESKIFTKGDQVHPDELIDRKITIAPEDKVNLARSVLTKDIFRREILNSPDFGCLDAEVNGRAAYIEFVLWMAVKLMALEAGDKSGTVTEALEKYGPIKEKIQSVLDEAEEIEFRTAGKLRRIAQFRLGRETLEYYVAGSKLYKRRLIEGKEEHDPSSISGEPSDVRAATLIFGQPLFRMNGYGDYEANFRNIQSELDQRRSGTEEPKQSGDNQSNENSDIVVKATSFFLRGFAQEASEYGDQELSTRALQFADSILPQADFEAVKQKRIGPNGELIVLPEDI
jgi:hypothetical protein